MVLVPAETCSSQAPGKGRFFSRYRTSRPDGATRPPGCLDRGQSRGFCCFCSEKPETLERRRLRAGWRHRGRAPVRAAAGAVLTSRRWTRFLQVLSRQVQGCFGGSVFRPRSRATSQTRQKGLTGPGVGRCLLPVPFPKLPESSPSSPRVPECMRSSGREARARESPEKRRPGGRFLLVVPKLEIALCGDGWGTCAHTQF